MSTTHTFCITLQSSANDHKNSKETNDLEWHCLLQYTAAGYLVLEMRSKTELQTVPYVPLI